MDSEKSFSDCGAVWLAFGVFFSDTSTPSALSETLYHASVASVGDYGSLSGQLSPAGPIIIIITQDQVALSFHIQKASSGGRSLGREELVACYLLPHMSGMSKPSETTASTC